MMGWRAGVWDGNLGVMATGGCLGAIFGFLFLWWSGIRTTHGVHRSRCRWLCGINVNKHIYISRFNLRLCLPVHPIPGLSTVCPRIDDEKQENGASPPSWPLERNACCPSGNMILQEELCYVQHVTFKSMPARYLLLRYKTDGSFKTLTRAWGKGGRGYVGGLPDASRNEPDASQRDITVLHILFCSTSAFVANQLQNLASAPVLGYEDHKAPKHLGVVRGVTARAFRA